MAVANDPTPTPDGAHEIEVTDTVHLQPLGIDVPTGATCEVTFRGTRGRFEVTIERHTVRYTLEGAGNTATLTGVFDDDGAAAKPERVPDWLARVVAETMDIKEVSLYGA